MTRLLLLALAFAATVATGAFAQPVGVGSPAWKDLSPSEKGILAPLAGDWDRLDAGRKQKWRGIAQRYPAMAPDQQQRVQEQMQSWARLSPEQRQAAREQYRTLRSLPPEKKQEVRQRWEQYQSLPPDTKRELASQPPPSSPPTGSRGIRPAPALPPPSPGGTAPAPAPTPAPAPPSR